MNSLFKPKDRDDVLFDIAKGRYENRALLIGLYEKHPELFDRFFNTLMKKPAFQIEGILIALSNGYSFKLALNGIDSAPQIIHLFTSLKFDVSEFKIENNQMWSWLIINISQRDINLLKEYIDLIKAYQRHKKKRKKRQAKKPLGF